MAIESVKSKDLQRVTIKSRHFQADDREWQDLDRVLVQLWTSRSIRPTIIFSRKSEMEGLKQRLLPELTKKEAVDVFEHWD